MFDKRRLTTALAKYLFNPLVKAGVAAGVLRGWAILETTGRRSGRRRRTPVGNGLQGDTFWIVAEHGRRAAYVRNLEANPRVRVFVHGRWRTGTARVAPEENPRERLKRVGSALSRLAVRLAAVDPVVVRVDLETDEESAGGGARPPSETP